MKILPLENPQVTSLWYYADLFSVINTVDQQNIWMLNHYINLASWNHYTQFYNGYTRNHMVEYYNCPFIDFQRIKKDTDKTIFGMRIIDFIINSLERNLYTILMIDRFYMKEYPIEYNTSHVPHEVMVYGYDLNQNVFFICDNRTHGKYERFKCSITSFEQAYIHFDRDTDHDFDHHLFQIMAKKPIAYDFNLEQVKKSMNQYLSSEVLMSMVPNGVFGIQSIDVAIEYLEMLKKRDIQFQIKTMHLLWDHKKCMTQRLNYLIDQCYIKEDTSRISKEYQEIENKMLLSRNSLIKYFLSGNKKIIDQTQNLLESIKMKEECVLKEVVSQLP